MSHYSKISIVAIYPTKGNPSHGLGNLLRAQSLAGVPFETIVLYDENDEAFWKAVSVKNVSAYKAPPGATLTEINQFGVKKIAATHVVALFDDFWPGFDWLGLMISTSQTGIVAPNTGTNDCLGFSAGLCEMQFLRDEYGDELWPVCYKHYFADSELGFRARVQGKYAYEPRAVLYHADWELGFRSPPSGDQLKQKEADRLLFNRRRREYLEKHTPAENALLSTVDRKIWEEIKVARRKLN